MATSQLRAIGVFARSTRLSQRAFTTSARQFEAAVSTKNTEAPPAPIDENKPAVINQAPNRPGVWSRSQKPRAQAMTGPRFEQTDFDLQVQPT
jgi:NADH dehydrogenase (ubiquinone) Fe-S protein 6